jgi:hypothetical protein
MKKNLLLLLMASAVFSLKTTAQNIQVKAGVLGSDWQGNGINVLNTLVGVTGKFLSRSPYVGYYAGASVNIPVAEKFSIEPGLIYSQTGTSLKGELGLKGIDFLNVNAQANMIQQRIEMPVLVKAVLANGLELMFGPQASYQLNSKLQVKAGAFGFNLLNRSFDMADSFEPFNVSAVGGLQYTMPSGLGVHALYEHGLTSIMKNRSAKVNTQSGRIGLSYRF